MLLHKFEIWSIYSTCLLLQLGLWILLCSMQLLLDPDISGCRYRVSTNCTVTF